MSLIPPFFLDCVTAIGYEGSWIGTGFLLGRFFKIDNDGKEQYHIYVATNKHVLNGFEKIKIKFNPMHQAPSKDYDVELINSIDKTTIWTGHPDPDVDVAVININPTILNLDKMSYSFFQIQNHLLTKNNLIENQTSEGDFVYVLGFPMGIVNPQRQYVIVRQGIIARIKDFLEDNSKDFLIDSSVFPGNSGGPVILKPELTSIEGTKPTIGARLIGMVQSYIPYQDIAISQQTKRPKVIFEENSGLASIIPTDLIIETVELAFKKMNSGTSPT